MGALRADLGALGHGVSFAIVLWYGGQRVIDGGLPGRESGQRSWPPCLFVVSPLKNLSRPSTVVQQATASAQRACSICSTWRASTAGEERARPRSSARYASRTCTFEYVAGEAVLRRSLHRGREG